MMHHRETSPSLNVAKLLLQSPSGYLRSLATGPTKSAFNWHLQIGNSYQPHYTSGLVRTNDPLLVIVWPSLFRPQFLLGCICRTTHDRAGAKSSPVDCDGAHSPAYTHNLVSSSSKNLPPSLAKQPLSPPDSTSLSGAGMEMLRKNSLVRRPLVTLPREPLRL